MVQDALEIKSPATAANAMRHLARAYKGETVTYLEGINKDVVTGKKLVEQLGEVGRFNPYRTAFYNIAFVLILYIFLFLGGIR